MLIGIKSNRRNDRNESQNVNDLLSLGPQNTCPQPLAGVSAHQLLNNQPISQSIAPQQSQTQCQTQQQSLVKQIVSTPNLPRAKALYNYDGNEVEGYSKIT